MVQASRAQREIVPKSHRDAAGGLIEAVARTFFALPPPPEWRFMKRPGLGCGGYLHRQDTLFGRTHRLAAQSPAASPIVGDATAP